MVLERSNPMSETIALDDGFPSDDDAEDPALDAMSGIGVSAHTGGMAETGAEAGKPEADILGADVDVVVTEVDVDIKEELLED